MLDPLHLQRVPLLLELPEMRHSRCIRRNAGTQDQASFERVDLGLERATCPLVVIHGEPPLKYLVLNIVMSGRRSPPSDGEALEPSRLTLPGPVGEHPRSPFRAA